jgi:hypothetical protein
VEEAALGVSFVRRRFHFAIDGNYLRKYADLALKQKHENPRILLPDILKEILRGVDYSERRAYFSAIGKMFSERNIQYHKVSA